MADATTPPASPSAAFVMVYTRDRDGAVSATLTTADNARDLTTHEPHQYAVEPDGFAPWPVYTAGIVQQRRAP